MNELEIIKSLFDANIRLTEQIVTLAQTAMQNYQPGLSPSAAPLNVPFALSTTEDWDDIGGFSKGRTLHIREEEEDARFQDAIGGITGDDLERALKTADFLNTEIQIAD